LNEEDFTNIKNRILLLINNEKFNSLIKDSEFITEQSLVYKEEIKIIDLLLFKEDNYYIIDYKTTKEQSVEHITQVAYYKKAIKDIFKTQNVFSYLIYLQENEILISEV
jgi:exodeoxyribonuclease V beta subunit